MRKLIVPVLAAAIVASTSWAAAASLGVTSRKLGAGGSAVSRCDADGVTLTYNYDANGDIASITAAGISAACAGGFLRLVVAESTGASLATASVSSLSLTNGSVTVPLSAAVPVANVGSVNIVVEGR